MLAAIEYILKSLNTNYYCITKQLMTAK